MDINKKKKEKQKPDENLKVKEIEINEELINVTGDDERPGIGWEITGGGNGGN